jgi:hypothetical protein
VDGFLTQIRDELLEFLYLPLAVRKKNTQGPGQQSPCTFDSGDSRPRGPGSVKAHSGTDLRGRLSTGVVWLRVTTDGSAGGVSCGGSDYGGRSESSTLTSRPTSRVFGTMCCYRKWRGECKTAMYCRVNRKQQIGRKPARSCGASPAPHQ